MSLITRCPACATWFRVVPDQLRISEGWVRCGQCDEIFDAALHLLPDPPPAPAPVAGPPAPAAAVQASDRPELTAQSLAIDLDLDLDIDAIPLGSAAALPPLLAQPPEPAPEAAWPAHAAAAAAEGQPPSDQEQARRLTPPPAPAAEFDAPDSELGAGVHDASFLRSKPGNSFWRRPLLRAAMGFLSLLLLVTLAGQIVLHQRDRLAASQPGLKPWLLTLCGVFNCTLSPLRRIDALVIESSSFSRLEGDAYRLNFTLKNTASTALALPALELTMTDPLDQPLARRVLLPGELGARSDTLAAGAEWPASVALAVKTTNPAERVAGYRLLVFYP